MVASGKGILAADEAVTNMGGFTDIGVDNIEENRRRWRQLLFEIPNLSDFLRFMYYDANRKINRVDVKSKYLVERQKIELNNSYFSGVIVNRETVEHLDDKGVPLRDILRQKVSRFYHKGHIIS